jgi:DNA-binding GntR family transcriptional regulator
MLMSLTNGPVTLSSTQPIGGQLIESLRGRRREPWSHLQAIKMNMDRVRYLYPCQFPLQRLLGEHRSIVEALAGGDPGAAEAGIRLHLRGVLEDLPLIAAAQPDYFETEPDASGSEN